MLDGPVIYWNNSSLFPYSQSFLQSRPSRFHNSVEIIIVSQGSGRALQIMDKILSPLSEDAPSPYWSLQRPSVLGGWSYLSMGSKLRSQYQLIGGKIHQKSLNHHPEEAIHYFLHLLVSLSYSSVGFPAPHQTLVVPHRLWFHTAEVNKKERQKDAQVERRRWEQNNSSKKHLKWEKKKKINPCL